MIVLDTHATVWWASEPDRLGAAARRSIGDTDRIGIPAIVFWETSLLVRKRRLALDMPVAEWAAKIQSIPRVDALPLTAEIALLADSLKMHADPADRFLVATALHHRAALVSKDQLLRRLKVVRTIW